MQFVQACIYKEKWIGLHVTRPRLVRVRFDSVLLSTCGCRSHPKTLISQTLPAQIVIPSAGALMLPLSAFFLLFTFGIYLFTLAVGESSGCLR